MIIPSGHHDYNSNYYDVLVVRQNSNIHVFLYLVLHSYWSILQQVQQSHYNHLDSKCKVTFYYNTLTNEVSSNTVRNYVIHKVSYFFKWYSVIDSDNFLVSSSIFLYWNRILSWNTLYYSNCYWSLSNICDFLVLKNCRSYTLYVNSSTTYFINLESNCTNNRY